MRKTGRMMRWTKGLLLVLLAVFLFPAALSAGWWLALERPGSWREADWSSAGILPTAASEREAVIHVMAARTGGLKGALSTHSWIVAKRAGASAYDRYDKVGWGNPVRRNAYAADARWYSNTPFFVKTVRGERAARLIPKVEAAIAAYPHSARGGYRIWPGPNSNSFVAHVLRQVPELDATLPSTAVGRDYLADGSRWGRFWHVDADGLDAKLSFGGLAGISAGMRSGLEVNLLGLVAGVDVRHPAIKLPGFGRLGFAATALAGE